MPKVTPLIKENKILQREAERRDDLMGGEIEKWIRVSRLSKAEISVAMGIGLTTLHDRIRNPGEFKVKELRILADLVGIDVSILVT